MNLFMGLLTDPFVAGRNGGAAPGGGATPYAEEGDSSLPMPRRSNTPTRDAFAKIPTKADAARNDLLDNALERVGRGLRRRRQYRRQRGARLESATARAFGFVAGADYRISPTMLAGFALAGGGTNFSVNSFGTGRSDLFQAGAFVRHTFGAAYVSGAPPMAGRM